MHDFGCLLEIKQAIQETRVMACRDDKVSIQSTSQPRDLIGASADSEVRAAIRVDPAGPLE
jgi:hypothetical protein